MADMISDEFAGLGGLETDERDEMKRLGDTLIKFEVNTTNQLGEAKRKAQRKMKDAQADLESCAYEWLTRDFHDRKNIADVMSRHGQPLQEDQNARRNLRRLYNHLRTFDNPIIVGNNAESKSQLNTNADDLFAALANIAHVDTSNSALWVPEERPLPLKDWRAIQLPTFVPPPEPWELPIEPEVIAHNSSKPKPLNSGWIYYEISPSHTPGMIVGDIISGKRTASDRGVSRMPLYVPPSYIQRVPSMMSRSPHTHSKRDAKSTRTEREDEDEDEDDESEDEEDDDDETGENDVDEDEDEVGDTKVGEDRGHENDVMMADALEWKDPMDLTDHESTLDQHSNRNSRVHIPPTPNSSMCSRRTIPSADEELRSHRAQYGPELGMDEVMMSFPYSQPSARNPRLPLPGPNADQD